MRNLKILGLALVAMFAMSAVGASMASADELTAEDLLVNLYGSNESGSSDSFGITAGNTSCKEVTYDIGTVATPTTSVTATPTYSTFQKDGVSHNCLSIGFPATIHMNGCDFIFNVTSGSSTVGDAAVGCPAGKEVTVTAISAGTIKCTIHVPPQTLTGDVVTYSVISAGPTREVTVSVNAHGITYKHTEGTGLGKCPTGSGIAGTFVGKGTVTATNHINNEHRGLFLSAT